MQITLKEGPLYVIATVPKIISLSRLISSHSHVPCCKLNHKIVCNLSILYYILNIAYEYNISFKGALKTY
jgi:hypothetical protein